MTEPTPLPAIELEAEAAGERLDVFVARLIPSLTRACVQKLIDQGPSCSTATARSHRCGSMLASA
jgi:hypothetical protein